MKTWYEIIYVNIVFTPYITHNMTTNNLAQYYSILSQPLSHM